MSFVRPEEVVKNFGLEPGMVVADFGCGSGHYTMAAAKAVGKTGTVYGIDIQKELLEAVKSRAEISDLKNIQIVWADLERDGGSRLADNSVDFVIISNILFQAEDKELIAREAMRILKDKGRVAVIEWEKGKNKLGPVPTSRIAQEEAEQIFIKSGFKVEREFNPGDHHYGLIFIKYV